jgi:hypothetical protein
VTGYLLRSRRCGFAGAVRPNASCPVPFRQPLRRLLWHLSERRGHAAAELTIDRCRRWRCRVAIPVRTDARALAPPLRPSRDQSILWTGVRRA